MRKLFHKILLTFTLLAASVQANAQEVIVNLTPVQQVLPPQVMLYLANPGRYFTLQLTNTSSEPQYVHLGIQIEQFMPTSDLSLSTPPKRQPREPIVVPANSTIALTSNEMKHLFDHIPQNEISCPANLFDDYYSGKFGLLPEGQYRAHVTAYKWNDPQYQEPVTASNPNTGQCTFTVCYSAQPPQFLLPTTFGATSAEGIAEVDPLNALFTWTMPTLTCNSKLMRYEYSFRVVEMPDGWSFDDAMDHGPTVYRRDRLFAPQCIIPTNIITSEFNANKRYIAQVTAEPVSSSPLDYVTIVNEGKSEPRIFRISVSDKGPGGKIDDPDGGKKPPIIIFPNGGDDDGGGGKNDNGGKKDDGGKDDGNKFGGGKPDGKKQDGDGDGGGYDGGGYEGGYDDGGYDDDDDDDDDGVDIRFGGAGTAEEIDKSKLYTFRNPVLIRPNFEDNGPTKRKMFAGTDLDVAWEAVEYIGGEGLRADTLKFSYQVDLFNGGQDGDKDSTPKTKPIFSKKVNDTDDLKQDISWNEMLGKVNQGDYLMIKVTPTCTNQESVAFVNDDVNWVDFGIVERMSAKYFECSNMLTVSDKEPTTEDASKLKGKTIAIGEYQMTIEEIKKGGDGLFEGKGIIVWKPLGYEIALCVEFKKLGINKSHVVYTGEAKGYGDPAQKAKSDIEAAQKIFTDWGIDNYIGDLGISSKDLLQDKNATDIAKQAKLSKYYGYTKTARNVWDQIIHGKTHRVYMPLSIPKDLNTSPVDVQIVNMTFAATHATMDILGEFVLPDTKYTDNDILVLGAPRLCISPEHVIPESGHLALLSDFTVKDPKTSYDMTFKAPHNPLTPADGCYISWHNYKFEILGVDVDMTIPGLKKDVDGKATKDKPKLSFTASIANWNDFLVDDMSMESFQVDDLPGWTFTAKNIVYDHSNKRNSYNMGAFPSGFVKSKAGVYKSDNSDWQGLYIKEIGILFPKSLEINSGGKKRLEISGDDMFFDKSGATLHLGADNVISAKTGKLGGWSFSLDNVTLNFIQNDYKNCKFSGKFNVPVVDSDVAYTCQILRQTRNGYLTNDYAYIFKTQSISDTNLDFILAQADFKNKQTYLLVESMPKTVGGSLETKVEFVMGGDITIGGTDYLNNVIKKKLKMNFEIPGVHFSHMRVANCSEWTSQYEKDLQKGGAKDNKGTTLYAGKEIKFGGSCYFHTGRWSLASFQKTLGPFDLTLEDFKISNSGTDLSFTIDGKIALLKGLDLSAEANITIKSKVKNISDISKVELNYDDTKFNDISLHTSFAGLTIDGTLSASNSTDANKSEGYSGTLKIKLPGDLFTVDAKGGYYKYASGSSKFTWGFFDIKLGSAVGVHIDPVVIKSVHGGFYFNCKKDGSGATPEDGLIGVIAGMGLESSAGKSVMGGDFDVTVVYDKKNKRLSTFMFDGSLTAVAGLVDTKASIVYQHDNTDKFFALNITVDAKADGAKLAKQYAGEYGRLGDLMKTLNPGYEQAVGNVEQGLQGKIDENTGANNGHKTNAQGGDTSVKASAGVTITLDFKVTMKKNGKNLNPTKWHIYLGEPDVEKRCSFTLIDFKSKIVNVKIGANAYLCVGNELPNDGALPPIPSEISNFLNGSTKGSGVVSDDVSKANKARTRALEDFKADVKGGVMLGAQVYGYIDVDLGIFYGSMGQTAGFDVSLRLLDNASCTNLGRKPGWNGWYGEGQLYAYLYAKFGLRINLGFFQKDFPIVDAGIGGVLNMGGPKPTYFTGKARVKLRLLGGLVNMNRSFKFECGDRCDLFLGNALDNFQLFGECSIADTTKTNGWNDKAKINPVFTLRPTISTDAPLDERFRVLDETELNRVAKQFDKDKEQLKSLASRTFIFRADNYVTLYEYSSKNSTGYSSKKVFYFKGKSRSEHTIDMMELNPNRYYKLYVTGWAKEIERGQEVDPVYYDTKTGKYTHKPWRQTKVYYFCTGAKKAIEDCPDLQEYVALAYPSYYNQIKDIKSWVQAYVHDVKGPTIALKTNLKGKAFKNGQLKWALYDQNWKKLDEVNAYFAMTNNSSGSTCNIEPERTFNGVQDNKYYYVCLNYVQSTKDSNGKIKTKTTYVATIPVKARTGLWVNGFDYKGTSSADYDKPFVSSRINSVDWTINMPGVVGKYSDSAIGDRQGTQFNGNSLKYDDPYWYISYLSNFAFVGGWRADASRIDVWSTTTESLIYTSQDGVYEGKLAAEKGYNTYNDYSKIREMSIYTDWWRNVRFPLPIIDDNKYNYVTSGLPRIRAPKLASAQADMIQPYLKDMYTPYKLAEQMSIKMKSVMSTVADMGGSSFSTSKTNDVESWNNARMGMYLSYTWNGCKLEVPYYQFPIVWGGTFDNSGTAKKVTMWRTFPDMTKSNERGHRAISWSVMDNLRYDTFVIKNGMLNRMSNANFSVYRVNAYDYIDGQYVVVNGLAGGDTWFKYDVARPLQKYKP